MSPNRIYRRFIGFLLPLAITLIVVEFGIQAVSAGMARVPQATETLAAYGVAWGLILLFTSPLTHAKSVSLVMADSPKACQRVVRFLIGLALLMMAGLAVLALTPISFWVIEEVHAVSHSLGDTVRFAILCLIPAPLLTGLAQYYTGQLLRLRRTVIVSLASITSVGSGIVLVILLLPTSLIQERPIWLPIIVTYVNLSVDLSIGFWGTKLVKKRDLEAKQQVSQSLVAQQSRDQTRAQSFADTNAEFRKEEKEQIQPASANSLRASAIPRPTAFSHIEQPSDEIPPTYREIFQFIWPLSMNISFQEFSRPLINMFVSRGPNGIEALAVLTVAYALGQFPYRWLNDLRNLAAAFKDEPNIDRYIRRFSVECGFVSLAMMLGLYWTPLADTILLNFMGLEPDFAALCRVPLMIFAVFSPIVVLRSYGQGITLVEKRTHIIAYCAPTRLLAVWLTLVTLPLVGLVGAPLGVAALAMGFGVEALTIWWGVRGYAWFRGRAGDTAPRIHLPVE